MTTRRRAVRGRRGSPRRRTTWQDTRINMSVAAAGQESQDLLAGRTRFEKEGLTLVRTLIDLVVRPQTLGAVVGHVMCGMAIAVIEEDANAASAYPDILADVDTPSRGWVWKNLTQVNDHTTGATVERLTNVKLDLRSRRRIGDEDLMFIGENIDLLGTNFTVDIDGLIRMLFTRG